MVPLLGCSMAWIKLPIPSGCFSLRWQHKLRIAVRIHRDRLRWLGVRVLSRNRRLMPDMREPADEHISEPPLTHQRLEPKKPTTGSFPAMGPLNLGPSSGCIISKLGPRWLPPPTKTILESAILRISQSVGTTPFDPFQSLGHWISEGVADTKRWYSKVCRSF